MVKKAVILAGGRGTRMLPFSKACPKELAPLADKPALHYIVKEAVEAGIEEILIVIAPDKEEIIKYFTPDDALEKSLSEQGKSHLIADLKYLTDRVKINYVVQETANGTGGAVLLAEDFAAGQPVLVMNGDDLMCGNGICVSRQLIDCFSAHGKAVLAVLKVSDEELINCGSVRVIETHGREMIIDAIIEKPKKGEEYSNYASQGRYVLPSTIFGCIKQCVENEGEKILTDAINGLATDDVVYAYEIDGKRYDLGSKIGYLKAEIEFALDDDKLHDEVLNILLTYGGTK